MKKYFIMAMFSLMIVCLAACGKKSEIEEDKSTKEETVKDNDEKEKIEISEDSKENEKEKAETSEKVPEKVSVNVYIANSKDGTLKVEKKECEELNVTVLWKLLKETGIIPEGSEAISLNEDGDKLLLDVDSVFGEQLRSQGTAGEREILGCVVNTFLDAYDCEEIKITEEGQVLLSGHAEYADYFTKF